MASAPPQHEFDRCLCCRRKQTLPKARQPSQGRERLRPARGSRCRRSADLSCRRPGTASACPAAAGATADTRPCGGGGRHGQQLPGRLAFPLQLARLISFVRSGRDCSPLWTAPRGEGVGPVFARSDRSRRQRPIGTDERQVIGRGQSLAYGRRSGAVRTYEHEPQLDRGCGCSSRTTAVGSDERNHPAGGDTANRPLEPERGMGNP
jgi:hypothetical protein